MNMYSLLDVDLIIVNTDGVDYTILDKREMRMVYNYFNQYHHGDNLYTLGVI